MSHHRQAPFVIDDNSDDEQSSGFTSHEPECVIIDDNDADDDENDEIEYINEVIAIADDFEIIDMDSDEQVRRQILDSVPVKLGAVTQRDPTTLSPFWISHDRFAISNGCQLTNGVTVKMNRVTEGAQKEYFHICGIYENKLGEPVLRGLRLRGFSDAGDARKEVAIVQNLYPHENNGTGFVLEDVKLDAIQPRQRRSVVFTNQKLQDTHHYQLVCCWKQVSVHSTISKHDCQEYSLVRLRGTECSYSGVPDTMLRQQRLVNQEDRVGSLEYTFLDGFCGIGLGSGGAQNARLKIIAAFDQNGTAVVSYSFNFPDAVVHQCSVFDFLRQYGTRYRVDILQLSPPCQFFAHCKTQPGKNDEANEVAYLCLWHFVSIVNPRIIVLEQTSGLHRIKKHELHMQTLLRTFREGGYSYRLRIVNMANWGVVQQRKRLIIKASAPGETLPPFPPETHNKDCRGLDPSLLPCVTMRDVLSKANTNHPNHQVRYYARHERKAPVDLDKQLAHCITCNCPLVHPSGLRELSMHEALLFQGANNDHVIFGTKTEMKRGIGNGSPSLFMGALYSECVRSLEETDRLQAGQERREAHERRRGRRGWEGAIELD